MQREAVLRRSGTFPHSVLSAPRPRPALRATGEHKTVPRPPSRGPLACAAVCSADKWVPNRSPGNAFSCRAFFRCHPARDAGSSATLQRRILVWLPDRASLVRDDKSVSPPHITLVTPHMMRGPAPRSNGEFLSGSRIALRSSGMTHPPHPGSTAVTSISTFARSSTSPTTCTSVMARRCRPDGPPASPTEVAVPRDLWAEMLAAICALRARAQAP